MSKREAFLKAACKENVEDFLHFLKLHKDKAQPFDVEEVVQEMPREQRTGMWEQLSSLLRDVLLEFPPEQWDQSKDKEEMDVESKGDPEHVMAVVDGVTVVATLSLKVLEGGDNYEALLEIAHQLHDVLVSLPVSEAHEYLHICLFYEAWWKKGLQDKDKFGRSALISSLQRSLKLKKAAVEIQRVWSLHDVLLSVDYQAEDNKQLTDLLLQCFLYPLYIRSDDGQRFLVFLFSWNIDFIWFIHSTIKNQLDYCKKAMTANIMNIYFRAWKKASGDFLEKIESTCIQDLMQHAILLPRASPVHTKVRQIVSHFHSKKSHKGVDKMLYSLYKPILWKALSATNSEVRANATLILTDAFPIHDPDQTNEHLDGVIQKQLDTVMELLDDPNPCVRTSATLGICKILSRFWELLPPEIITDFLKKLLMELAADSRSDDVRCSVFMCLNMVLDNPLSHPVLEKLLPSVKNSLHDNSEKVRAAFLNMLIKVKAVRAAKFWDVCNTDHLLARLAMDTQSVSKRIVDLLFKSFFPPNESATEWCRRCITLIQMNPVAARKFYQHVYIHTSPTNIMNLMLAIRRVLNTHIQGSCEESVMNDKENSQEQHNILGEDMDVIASLLEVVVILWKSIWKCLRRNEEAQKNTYTKFGNVMGKYFNTFKDERCTVALIQLASFMPRNAVPSFSGSVLSRLRNMESGVVPVQYNQLLDCMCMWGEVSAVLDLITTWLTEALPKPEQKAKSSRKVQIQDPVEAKPDLALAYLDALLIHTSTREKVLALGHGPLQQLHAVLGKWQSVLSAHLSSSTTKDPKGPDVEVALKAFMYHSRLGEHLQHNFSEGRDYLLSLENSAMWVADSVLPFFTKRASDDGEEKTSQQLAAQITENFLSVCRDVVLVGLGDETFKTHLLQLCSVVLSSDGSYLFIPSLLRILKEVVATYAPNNNNNNNNDDEEDPTIVVLGVVAQIFQKIIELLAHQLRKEPEEAKLLYKSALPGLTDFLQLAQTWESPPLSGVFSTLFAIIIVEKRHAFQKIYHPEEVVTPGSVEDMPPLTAFLLSVILKSASLTRVFLAEIVSSLDSEVISNLTNLAAVLHVLAVIRHAGHAKASLKHTAVCVQQQLDKHVVTDVDSRNIQRVIYESSVKTLNEILDS